jgi:hypothetical protein
MYEIFDLGIIGPLPVSWYAYVGMGGMFLFGVAAVGLYLLMELS